MKLSGQIWNGADEDAHTAAGSSVATNQPPAQQPQNQDMGRIFVVGLEQVEAPHCVIYPSTGTQTCVGPRDYTTKLFFFTEETDKICGDLTYFQSDDQTKSVTTKDEKRFNELSFPGGEWSFTFWGEQYKYMSNGQNEGALWFGQRGIECKGNLVNHGKLERCCERHTLTLVRPTDL
jgi:hypothetical protein